MRPRRYLVEADARAGLVALALLLAIPAVGAIFTDHAARSKWENRKLAEFPTSIGVRDDAKPVFGDLERFLDDHFGLAVPINRLYRRLVYFVFRDSPAREVTRGLDGFLFFNPGAGGSKRYSAFQTLCLEATDPAVIDKAWRSWISSLRRFRQQGYRVGVAIAPSKQVIYPEKLPDSVPRIYREACSSYAGRPSLARKGISLSLQ